MTKLEILTETITFYSEDTSRRSIGVFGGCAYNGENNTHCAVGRCLLEKYHECGKFFIGNTLSFHELIAKYKITHDDMLQEKYRGHELDFWVKLQNLHDKSYYWDNSGITTVAKLL